jgi:guanylate kinase
MKLIVLTAPSGAGKTSIARRILDEIPRVTFSVSATTRDKRPGEVDGKDYHFLSPSSFRARIEQGDFLEYEEVYPGILYGTLKSEVERTARTHHVLFDVDVRGALNIKRLYGPEALVIYIKPPSLEALRDRLMKRNTETPESVAARLERARKELEFEEKFDAIIVNQDLEVAVAETLRLVNEFLLAPSNSNQTSET